MDAGTPSCFVLLVAVPHHNRSSHAKTLTFWREAGSGDPPTIIDAATHVNG